MSNIKAKRIASSIVRELSDIFHNDINNTHLKSVNIVDASVTGDLSFARIYVTYYGDLDKDLILQDLQKATSFLRNELAHRLDLRSMPELKFIYDESIEYSNHIESIIENIHNN